MPSVLKEHIQLKKFEYFKENFKVQIQIGKAKLFQEATFFIISFTYLPEVNLQVHCSFLPVYLLWVSKNDDEKRCFLK